MMTKGIKMKTFTEVVELTEEQIAKRYLLQNNLVAMEMDLANELASKACKENPELRKIVYSHDKHMYYDGTK
jgi:hypothetical protein